MLKGGSNKRWFVAVVATVLIACSAFGCAAAGLRAISSVRSLSGLSSSSSSSSRRSMLQADAAGPTGGRGDLLTAQQPQPDDEDEDEESPTSALYAALTQAGILDAVLEIVLSGPYTLFAPTDGAFAKAADAAGVSLMDLLVENPELGDILKYHVIMNATVMTDDLFEGLEMSDELEVETLTGDNITVSMDENGSLILNGEAKILVPDYPLLAGVVHVIDTVLMPNGTDL